MPRYKFSVFVFVHRHFFPLPPIREPAVVVSRRSYLECYRITEADRLDPFTIIAFVFAIRLHSEMIFDAHSESSFFRVGGLFVWAVTYRTEYFCIFLGRKGIAV